LAGINEGIENNSNTVIKICYASETKGRRQGYSINIICPRPLSFVLFAKQLSGIFLHNGLLMNLFLFVTVIGGKYPRMIEPHVPPYRGSRDYIFKNPKRLSVEKYKSAETDAKFEYILY
jgi:hypothetical protein